MYLKIWNNVITLDENIRCIKFDEEKLKVIVSFKWFWFSSDEYDCTVEERKAQFVYK